eukprot:6535345-Alexandrium_andersonii.AAC.1
MGDEPRCPSEEVQNSGKRARRAHPPFSEAVFCLQQCFLLCGGGVPRGPGIPGLVSRLHHPGAKET